jgi:MATE family multidrug resistance protein
MQTSDSENDSIIDIEEENESPSLWSLFKNIVGLSLPMALSYTFNLQMVLLVYLLGNLDEDESNLASITLITSLLNTVIIIGISPLFSMSIIAGREIGELCEVVERGEDEALIEERRAHIASIHRNGLILGTAVMPFMISSMVASKPLLHYVFNQDEMIASFAQDFTRPYALTIPAVMMRLASEQIMFGFGQTKPAMIMALTSFGLCMSLGGLLAFGALGFPRLGKTGVLIGCISESYLTAIAFSFYIAKHPAFRLFHFFDLLKPFKPTMDQLKKMFQLGKSFLFTVSIETGLVLMNSVLAGLVGTEAQAASSSIALFTFFSLLLSTSFGQSCSQEMSRKLGERKFLDVSRIGKVSLFTTLGFVIPIPLIISIDPSLLMKIMGKDSESLLQILRYFIPIISVGCIADAARYNILQQLRALGDTQSSAYISSIVLNLGLGASAALSLGTSMGIYGVATGYSASNVLATAALFYRWTSQIKPEAIRDKEQQPMHTITERKKSCFAHFFKPFVKKNALENIIELHESLLSTVADSTRPQNHRVNQ